MGRFLASLACYLGVPGRIVLGISSLGCLLMSILSMLLPARDGALASFMLLTFFQGPFLPTSFAMTLRGLGRHTKLVSTGLTMALSGGGVWPSISWAVQRDHNGSDRYMMRVSVIIYTVMLVIIAVVNLHPTIRHWVDADRDATAAPFEAGQDIRLTTLGTV
jgi:fucose permease